MRQHITGIILTLDEEKNILDAIDSLRWTDHIIVVDSFSSDHTVPLARRSGAEVVTHEFVNYADQRNTALELADTEWVFFLDADERVPPPLAGEVLSKLEQPQRGWWVPRHNFIFGRLTRSAGWYPDYQMRLLHRESARYDPTRTVHEEVQLQGESGYLENALIHFNYDDRAEFIRKQEKYTNLEAQTRHRQGQRPRPWTFLTAPLRHFWWRFITLGGYRDGFHGLNLSMLMAYYEFETWRRVARLSETTPRINKGDLRGRLGMSHLEALALGLHRHKGAFTAYPGGGPVDGQYITFASHAVGAR
ncbi:MAG: glycosyltransferase family 2 protein [Chloroflexi bacterium]|nr:glycosyltransferase family 2 protein [Chloroflexota bacterium]